MAIHIDENHILIVDDSITNVLMLQKLVESEKLGKAKTVIDPREVMPLIEADNFDLVCLDLEMPHINGLQLLDMIRSQYSLDALPIVILTGTQDGDIKNRALIGGANDYINKPFDQLEVLLRITNILKVKQSYDLQKSINEELEKKVQLRTKELNDATQSIIHRLSYASEIRDKDTGKHVIRVGKYARILAEESGLPADIGLMIEHAAPMHDIGKIGIPDEILLKKGKLTKVEKQEMNNHTHFGAKLLGDHPSMVVQMAKVIALSHHERWDGMGYPNHLKGESIPMEGRITTLCDVFDALTTQRPYKPAWKVEDAVNHIKHNAGKIFDPELVKVFIHNLDKFLSIKEQLQD
jgi:putative two-component system response regulator